MTSRLLVCGAVGAEAETVSDLSAAVSAGRPVLNSGGGSCPVWCLLSTAAPARCRAAAYRLLLSVRTIAES